MKMLKRTVAFFRADESNVRLTRLEAAEMLHCSLATMNTYACSGRGPKSYKDASGIYYLSKEVEEYISIRHSSRKRKRS